MHDALHLQRNSKCILQMHCSEVCYLVLHSLQHMIAVSLRSVASASLIFDEKILTSQTQKD